MIVLTRSLGLFVTSALCALLLVPSTHAQISISEARSQGVGATVTVEGTVTRAYDNFVRFQDQSGPTGVSGLTVRQTSGGFHDDIADGTITQGTELQVTGTLSEFRGLLQINKDDLNDYTVQGQGALPDSQDVTLATLRANGEDYESELVRVTGLDFVTAQGTYSNETSYTVTDESGTATFEQGTLTFRVQTTDETALAGEAVPEGAFNYTGVVGEFSGQYQLIPVRPADVQPATSFGFRRPFVQAQEGSGTVQVAVRAYATGGETVSVTAQVGDESTATNGTDVTGFTSPQTLNFTGEDPPAQMVSFDVADDEETEGVERLEVVLESDDGTLTQSETFTLWVLDDATAQATIAEGDSGDVLLEALQQQYGDPRPLGYDLARDSMYARIYNEANTVEGTYSGYQITVDPSQGDPSAIAAGKDINTEHTWPQSKGAGQEPARSNLHILVPTRDEVNSARSNLPYGDSPDADTDQWFFEDQVRTSPPTTDLPLWSELLSNQRFEPRHSVKGDVARAVFYFVTVYPNRADFSFFEAQRDTLLAWHEQDPVDATEMRRNLLQASYQDNALNPYVVDPSLADRVYGSGADEDDGPPPTTATFELFADQSDLTPPSGQTDAQCLVQRATGELVFFNSDDGGIFSWEGSTLTEERSASNVNGDISGEAESIDRCDGAAVDANDNVYFLLRASQSSSQNSWPTFVYKLPASGTPSVLASEDGLQGITHDAGTVYLTGVSFRGAPSDGFFSISDAGEDQSLTTITTNSSLDLDYGIDIDQDGELYAFSGEFASGAYVERIVRVTDPSGNATLETFVNPYRTGSPLVPDSPNDIDDLEVVTFGGTEYIVVFNNSFEANSGDQWATIEIADEPSIDLLFTRDNLVANLPVDDYVSGFTEPMAVNSDGEVFVASRTLGEATDYIAKVSDAPPLPVELTALDAVKSGATVDLRWKTASETNNAQFVVERKRSEGQWSEIGAVEGAGTTETPQAYRFTDARPPFEADALTYRLKQVDLDGSVSYSKTITVKRAVEEVTLQAPFPNPVRRQATIQFAVPERKKVTLRLYDVLGRRVKTLVDGQQDGRQQAQFDVSGLSSGVYFLRLRAEGTRRTERLTVVQ